MDSVNALQGEARCARCPEARCLTTRTFQLGGEPFRDRSGAEGPHELFPHPEDSFQTPWRKKVVKLWILWKTQDTNVWMLWITPVRSLLRHGASARIGAVVRGLSVTLLTLRKPCSEA